MATIPAAIRERYKKLKDSVNHYRTQRHVYDIEEIPIEAEDALKQELSALEREYPALIAPDSPSVRVGGAPLPHFKKVLHHVPQWSFNDAFSEEDVREWGQRVRRGLAEAFPNAQPTYTTELKIDGL